MKSYADHDSYIADFPEEIQARLQEIRKIVAKTAPKAKETVKYGIPTFELNGNLVHYAAYKNHIGFYPTPSAIEAFSKELASYVTSRGTVQIPHTEKLPVALIKRMVKFRVEENLAKAQKPNKKDAEKEYSAWPPVGLSAPAQRALVSAGIKTVKQLSKYSEAEILRLHGMGPKSIPLLKLTLKSAGLSFRK